MFSHVNSRVSHPVSVIYLIAEKPKTKHVFSASHPRSRAPWSQQPRPRSSAPDSASLFGRKRRDAIQIFLLYRLPLSKQLEWYVSLQVGKLYMIPGMNTWEEQVQNTIHPHLEFAH